MTRRFARPVWLVLVLMVCLVGSAPAARPESLEVRERGASRGLLTITVMDDGSAYIAPDHLAALLKGAWAVKGDRGTLTVGSRVAEFTRSIDQPSARSRRSMTSSDPRLAPSASIDPSMQYECSRPM